MNNLVFSKGHISKSKYLTTFIFGQGIEKQDTCTLKTSQYQNFKQDNNKTSQYLNVKNVSCIL